MKFSIKIQKLRKERGLSQDQLAAALEVSRQSVSKWELGDDMPKVDKILLLSDFFEVSTDYLLHDDWENDRPYASNAGNTGPAAAAAAAVSQKSKRLDIGFLLWCTAFFGVIFFLLYQILQFPDPYRAFLEFSLAYLPMLIPLCFASYLIHLLIRALKKYLGNAGRNGNGSEP